MLLRHERTATASDPYWRQVSPEVYHWSALRETIMLAMKVLGLLTMCDSIRARMP